jgi:hypothetical protein
MYKYRNSEIIKIANKLAFYNAEKFAKIKNNFDIINL